MGLGDELAGKRVVTQCFCPILHVSQIGAFLSIVVWGSGGGDGGDGVGGGTFCKQEVSVPPTNLDLIAK